MPKITATGPQLGNLTSVRLTYVSGNEARIHSRSKGAIQRLQGGGKAAHPLLEEKLVEYIFQNRASGCAFGTIEVHLYALRLMKDMNPASPFKALPKWCFFFINISIQHRSSIAQRMPNDFEQKRLDYQHHLYSDGLIANSDQTPLTFDIPFTQTKAHIGEKSIT